MAGVFFRAVTGAVACNSTTKTILQVVAASNHRVVIHKVKFYVNGTDTTAARVGVRILKQTTAGTMSSLTLVTMPPTITETLEVTAQHTATAEPTASTVQEDFYIDPTRENIYTYSGPELVVEGGTRLGFECTTSSTLNIKIVLVGEE